MPTSTASLRNAGADAPCRMVRTHHAAGMKMARSVEATDAPRFVRWPSATRGAEMTTATTIDPTTTIDHVLEAVHGLAPTIRARAGDMEAAREVPADMLDELVAAGAFRASLPPS